MASAIPKNKPSKSHLQLSTPDFLSWPKWIPDFWETRNQERQSFGGNEPVFRENQATVAYMWGDLVRRHPPSPRSGTRRSPEWSISLTSSLLYDPRKAYEEAKTQHDPYLSPHGLFRRLKHGDNRHAKEFLTTFGPLTLPNGINSPSHHRVSTTEFWAYHRRFCSVAQLWEAGSNRKKLVAAWQNLWRHRADAEAIEGPFFNKSPWELLNQDIEPWTGSANTKVLQHEAIGLLHQELNRHSQNTRIGWEKGWEPTKRKFRLRLFPESLWDAIWLFLGWDTASEMGWRQCPHCQRIFYPKRKDQYYCTPSQQALASKREYARRIRATAKRKMKR